MHTRIAFITAAAAFWVIGPKACAQTVAKLWSENCQSCHGASGGGTERAKSLLASGKGDSGDGAQDRRQFALIHDGLEGVQAHAFSPKFSDRQIWGLVVHVRELQSRDSRAKNPGPKAVDGIFASRLERYRLETLIEKGLETPWSVDFLPAGSALITQRAGQLRLFENGMLSEPIAGVPTVRVRGQGGLMDVAVHPRYAENGWIYLAYSDKLEIADKSPGMTTIVRGKLKRGADGVALWTDQQTIFEARHDDYIASDIHFGCRIVFDPKDSSTLFFCIGERGQGPHAQDLNRPNGKVHRLKDDGAIPKDNPFVDRGDKTYASIWSYGHRNPQGLVFDLDGRLWDTEHGPRGGDELNHIEKGRNYGWPNIAFSINYSGEPLTVPWPELLAKDEQAPVPDFKLPVHRWLPSIAACGLTVVGGEAFIHWKGDLLAGGLAGQSLRRLHLEATGSGVRVAEDEELLYGMGRIRDVVCAPDGSIWVVLNAPDKLIRLTPAGAQ